VEPNPNVGPVPHRRPDGTWHHIADGGEELVLHDVVGGAFTDLVLTLLALHERAFPAYGYVLEEIRRDARVPGRRDGVVVHQWVLTVDGTPAGYCLSESNRPRGLALLPFLTVDPAWRSLTVGGAPVGRWFLELAEWQHVVDVDAPCRGVIGETPEPLLPPFIQKGWRVLPVEYREPVHGGFWPTRGAETHEIPLIWRPPLGLPLSEVEAMEPSVAPAAAAAFLLDLYRLPDDLPWVRVAVGEEELARPRPDRDAW